MGTDTQNHEMTEALTSLLGDRPSIQNGKCVRCGRDYTGDVDLQGGECPSDDCPAYKARTVLAKIRNERPAETKGSIVDKLVQAIENAVARIEADDEHNPVDIGQLKAVVDEARNGEAA